jgi:hypothetical protein
MPFNVNDFRAAFVGSGARSNLFQVEMIFPPVAPDAQAALNLQFFCKAASLPASTIAPITIKYFGRELKYPGDRTFENWNITVYNDESFDIRNAFESWSDALNNHFKNLRDPAAALPRGYQVDAIVKQYSKIGGDPIKQVKLVGCWPSNLGAITLDHSQDNEIETFTVDIAYQWWESDTTS